MKAHKINVLKIGLFLVIAFFFQCQKKRSHMDEHTMIRQNTSEEITMKVITSVYGTTENGDRINSFALQNNNRIEIEIIEYGAIVATIKTPDKNGIIEDITLGYDELSGWENDPYYFGATIGRVANRTGGAQFILDGKTYDLAPNTLPDFGNNHLHGGIKPFNKVVWKGSEFKNDQEVGVVFEYLSKDGEEGYPGNLSCRVIYSLNNKNELKIIYKANTDQKTIVNMTHHSYYNLAGAGNGTILDQLVSINADEFTMADENLIPTGEILPVIGLPIDLKEARSVGSRMDEMQMKNFKGYDLNYIVNHEEAGDMDFAASAIDMKSGRKLEVSTTQPCMHFYTSNFLDGKPGRSGASYIQYGAFCFEPQAYPDAANKSNFESIVISPEDTYEQTIIYKFSVVE